MTRIKFSMGRELDQVTDISAALRRVRQQQFDSLLIPIAQQPAAPNDQEQQADRPVKPISSAEMRNVVYGYISTWIDLDSDDPKIRQDSENSLRYEIEWWAYLGMSAAVLPMPRSNTCHNYARVVNQLAAKLRTMKLLLRVPLQAESDDQSWHIWNHFRNLCEQSSTLGLALEITDSVPDNSELNRWYGEPLLMAILPTSVFATNQQGYPIIAKDHQALISQLFQRPIKLVLGGANAHKTAEAEKAYVTPLRELYQDLPPVSQQETFETPYYDQLLPPLQPLMDNLESVTYEVFEQDPVKYEQYEEAIYQALLDKHTPDELVTIMVVGAGRGPLVRRALRAAERSKRQVFIYAVEKNPNAITTLYGAHANENWQGRVEIIAGDMRKWNPKERADIMVSELLGSFGDNELSPECLDGAQRYLKPETGISIPSESISYLAPISSQRLYNKVTAMEDDKYFETGFVVRMHNFCQLGSAQTCFHFIHPNNSNDSIERDNSRYVDLHFEANANAIIHGFVGYFEAVLYKDIMLSILPETISDGMSAWFPIYWPLKQPVQVQKGQSINAQFWRQVGPRDVWYEWALSEPQSLPIHNPNGRSYKIGL